MNLLARFHWLWNNPYTRWAQDQQHLAIQAVFAVFDDIGWECDCRDCVRGRS